MNEVRCRFVIRRKTVEGRIIYQATTRPGWHEDFSLHTIYPPWEGDLIFLTGDPEFQNNGVFKILKRCWIHAEYGSRDWPYGQTEPHSGPILEIIIEKAKGLYADEGEKEET